MMMGMIAYRDKLSRKDQQERPTAEIKEKIPGEPG
jgi:hypothetical protein